MTHLHQLQLDPDQLATPAAQRARLSGLLEAKAEAHRAAARLAQWARPLAVATTGVSGVHLWESLAAVKPGHVAALSLPDAVYHGSALALVAVIDGAIIFLSAAGNASAYAGYTQRSRALPLLYTITGGLNFAFLISYWPAMPVGLRAAVLPALAVVFPILLAVLIPALLVALERASHVLQATKLALGVEVATLRGLTEEPSVATEKLQPQSIASDRQQLPQASLTALPTATAAPITWAREVSLAPELIAGPNGEALNGEPVAGNTEAARIYHCRHCQAEGLTKSEQLAHGRRHARERKAADQAEVQR
jgi:hypothetical protein